MKAILLLPTCVLILAGACTPDSERPLGLSDTSTGAGQLAANLGGAHGGASYPPGPYGAENPDVGEVVADLSFVGYLSQPGAPVDTEKEPQSLTFSDVRATGASHLLMHVSSAWCGSCQREAYFMNEYTDQIEERGGTVLELLMDGQVAGTLPTEQELDVWVQLTDLRMTTVMPQGGEARLVFPDRDFVYIIDLQTMKVVWQEEGPTYDPTTTEVAALEMLSSYLKD